MNGKYDDRLRDYVDVAARIAEFAAKHPAGSLRPVNPLEPVKIISIGDKHYLQYVAAAYRTPDDPRPGIGVAWEPWPGTTPYTRDSEAMNAETSAWGRAIVAALAADTHKGIASADEVRVAQERQGENIPSEGTNVPASGAEPPATSGIFKDAAERKRVELIGTLKGDPEPGTVKVHGKEEDVCRFRLAVDGRAALFVTAWREAATAAADLQDGDEVHVRGTWHFYKEWQINADGVELRDRIPF